jgi:hypothetical protein
MPAANQPNTAPANEARLRIGDQKAADRLGDRGWLVLDPAVHLTSKHRPTAELKLLTAVGDATEWVMAAIGRQHAGRELPQLAWHFTNEASVKQIRGHMPAGVDPGREKVLAALQPWVDTFDLQPAPNPVDGLAQFVGEIEEAPVELWGIVDREAYDRIGRPADPVKET